MDSKQLTGIIVGAGHRAEIYAGYALKYPERLKIIGVADPNETRRNNIAKKFNLSSSQCYEDSYKLASMPRQADMIINGTMDTHHVETSIPLLEKGYDMLLEKPFALNAEEAKKLIYTVKKYKNKVMICHVLRYAPFYLSIKKHILNGDIGDIINIQQSEHVSYHHMMTSYVRGRWRSEKECGSAILLAKCCHDIDLMMWLKGNIKPVSVSSFGSEFTFNKHKKPHGAGSNCINDCSIERDCTYSAKRSYLEKERWGLYVWEKLETANLSEAEKYNYLANQSDYGKCVWDCPRDSNADNQTVIFKFEDDSSGVFTLVGGSAKAERNIHIVGTRGEIKGVFENSTYVVRQADPENDNGYTETLYNLKVEGDKSGMYGGHGGGDIGVIADFVNILDGKAPSIACTSVFDSWYGHAAVFAAVQSLKSGKTEFVEDIFTRPDFSVSKAMPDCLTSKAKI